MNADLRVALADTIIERAILGALIVHPTAWARIAGTLKPEHFSEQTGASLFKVIRTIAIRDGSVSGLAVRAALELDDDGGSHWRNAALQALMDIAPFEVGDIDGLTATLIEMWARRKLADAALWLEAEARRAYTSPFDLARDASHWCEDVIATGRSAQSTRATFAEVTEQLLDDIENGDVTSISTGIVELDRIIGGYEPGRLIILAGRPGMGKSSFAPCTARVVAKSGTGVLYASLEMTRKELAARLLTDAAWTPDSPIPYRRLLARDIEPRERERLLQVRERNRTLPLEIDDNVGLAVEELQARARRQAQEMARRGIRLGLVVVDHLGLLQGDAHLINNPVRMLGEIARRLKLMAKELNVCVLALCQLNRGVESRDEKRPTKADLRQSGEIEEHADQVLLLYREAYYLAKRKEEDPERAIAHVERLTNVEHDLEIIVDKNRHGPEGLVKAWADMSACAVRNASIGR